MINRSVNIVNRLRVSAQARDPASRRASDSRRAAPARGETSGTGTCRGGATRARRRHRDMGAAAGNTIVCDLEQSTVEVVAEDRETESLAAYYQQLTHEQRARLKAVAMDMWESYIGATRDELPAGDEKILFDRFHIMREMTKAVDTVPKQEHRGFLRVGDGSPLTGTKYLCCSATNDVPTITRKPLPPCRR